MQRVNAIDGKIDAARMARREFDAAMEFLDEDSRLFKRWCDKMADILAGDAATLARLEDLKAVNAERQRSISEMYGEAIEEGDALMKGLQEERESACRNLKKLTAEE